MSSHNFLYTNYSKYVLICQYYGICILNWIVSLLEFHKRLAFLETPYPQTLSHCHGCIVMDALKRSGVFEKPLLIEGNCDGFTSFVRLGLLLKRVRSGKWGVLSYKSEKSIFLTTNSRWGRAPKRITCIRVHTWHILMHWRTVYLCASRS